MEIFARILYLMTFIYISSAEKTITCPSCTHFDHALVPSAFKNEACLKKNVDVNDPDVGTTTCTASGSDVPKCLKFSGEVSFEIPIAGTQTVEMHTRSCTTETSDPGNKCEDVSGNQDSRSTLARLISKVLLVLTLISGEDKFSGQLCYYDESTSDAASLHVGLLALLVHLSLMYLIVAL
ncbi:uncharacterized protein [Ptychodera flava]|uniref:uncharacterized protein n=1 Tax=Ptychodera flava TaxID=63121 RepID=UPI003969EAFF